MPDDVTRSDSQRSDSSLRPRVSFNRDVHVKRIVPSEATRIPVPSDEGGGGAPSPVRKARLPKSKKELAEEAARVLDQVDKIDCISFDQGYYPEKFYSLPTRKKRRVYDIDSPHSAINGNFRRRSEELGVTTLHPPRKPPRANKQHPKFEKPPKVSVFNVFRTLEKDKNRIVKKSNLKRSVSDAANSKSIALKSGSDLNDINTTLKGSSKKKQLSPIIEIDNNLLGNNKENIFFEDDVKSLSKNKKRGSTGGNKNESVTEKLKQFIDEVDSGFNYEKDINNFGTGEYTHKKVPEVIIIDVDKAEKISKKKDKNKFNGATLAKTFKFLTNKRENTKNSKNKNTDQGSIFLPNEANVVEGLISKTGSCSDGELNFKFETNKPSPKILETIDNLQNKEKLSEMIHSSQKPVEKLPLTRGFAVDHMVKRLSNDTNTSPPPKSGILITPTVSVQHNNNQPFSYTRGQSPERNSKSPVSPSSPVIYAHVVCDKNGYNSGFTKQTVHTAYTNGRKQMPHSDSDEGLGNEEGSNFGKSKYDGEKTFIRFGDEQNNNEQNRDKDYSYRSINYYADESPIKPNFKNNGIRNNYSKTEQMCIDSSSRGRADGMDSKRRESFTEVHDNNFSSSKYTSNLNRSDLSARRDLLESRINKRMVDKNYHNKFVSETTSKYYRHGSASPVGYVDTYTSEKGIDTNGERYANEVHTRQHFEKRDSGDYNGRYKSSNYRYDNFENEPKSIHSQISEYRSSPENVNKRTETSHEFNKYSKRYKTREEKHRLDKSKEHYNSNPEIVRRYYDSPSKHDEYDGYTETYHDSLKRDKLHGASKCESEKYLDRNDSGRKDKFGDSGIENDFNRDRTPRSSTQRRDQFNESEDEGFASSLLIASERQHTEDNFNSRKSKRDYDSDKGHRNEREGSYRNGDSYEYRRQYKSRQVRNEYAPRERSIDDGSHYDPRLDKDVSVEKNIAKKPVDQKPPKPAKKSSLEKVKQLFSRDSNKKNKNKSDREMVSESNLRSRYTEYKGSREHLEPTSTKRSISNTQTAYDHSNRRRLSTPSPSPVRDTKQNQKTSVHNSWFKSLDRLARKKSKKNGKEVMSEEELTHKSTPAKSLRFFGDTDIESNDSIPLKSSIKTRSSLTNSNYHDRTHSHSTRDLHNMSEENRSSEFITPYKNGNYKSLINISETEKDIRGSKISLKPPVSPINRNNYRESSKGRDEKIRYKRNEASSAESSTEGDSSQQSQRNVVYLHAATVGDIPGPGYLRNGRRAASREELTSISSGNIRPQVKTLSRSFSVLAPWRPRHHKENLDINYDQQPKPIKNGKYEQKTVKNGYNRKDNSSTLKKKANETRRLNQSTNTLNRRSRSKENISQSTKKSKEDLTKGSTSTLYKKKERQPKENTRYNRDREDKRISTKSMSVESLGNGRQSSTNNRRDISRSISMPRDPEKSAGWFKINKKK